MGMIVTFFKINFNKSGKREYRDLLVLGLWLFSFKHGRKSSRSRGTNLFKEFIKLNLLQPMIYE